MKYVLKGKQGFGVMSTILENRGITDLGLVLNPNHDNDTNPLDIVNMDIAIKTVLEYLTSNILVLVDSDVDGMTSGASMYKYLRAIKSGGDLDYYLHKEKKHGLTNEFMDFISKSKHYDLIIVPDAGSNDVENIKILETRYNSRVIIIDHHEVDKFGDYGIIVNNQLSPLANKNLTGAGMVYLVCKALETHVSSGIMDDILNLVSIGQVGDSSNLIENEVRNMCFNSIRNIKNNFMRTVYTSESFKDVDLGLITLKNLSWGGVVPMINAVTRVGSVEDKAIVFQALADIRPDREFVVTKKKLNKEIRKYEMIDFTYNLYEYALEICENARKLQNKIVKNQLSKIECQYNPQANIQIFTLENKDEIKGITGLIANKLAEKYSNPCIVCWLDEDDIYKGSLRGNEEVLPNFKEWCLQTGLFKMVQGHANAAGIEISLENMIKLTSSNLSLDKGEGIIYDVDYIFGSVNIEDAKEVCNYNMLWDNGVEKPLFAFENIQIPTTSIRWSKNTLRIWINGVTIVVFKTPEEVFKELVEVPGYITINLVGTFEENLYNGNTYMQIKATDYEVISCSNKEEEIDFGMFF